MSRRLLVIVGCLAFVAGGMLAQGPKPADSKDKEKDTGPAKVLGPGDVAKVGDIIPDYAFRNLFSGDGRTSMKQFRGNVVVIDWWGMH
jgi:hypothetical protein